MLLYAPAFFTWLSAGIAAHPALACLSSITIGILISYLLTEGQLDEMKEELTQEECGEFFYALDKYMDDQNENTSVQTFALVDGKYVPIPTPVESPTGSGTSSSENESSSTDRSGAPPIM